MNRVRACSLVVQLIGGGGVRAKMADWGQPRAKQKNHSAVKCAGRTFTEVLLGVKELVVASV